MTDFCTYIPIIYYRACVIDLLELEFCVVWVLYMLSGLLWDVVNGSVNMACLCV